MDFFVLGGSELVTGFALAGVGGKACATREETLAAFREMTRPETALKVLILSEDASSLIEDELLEWQLAGEYPLIVEIPPLTGTATGRKSMVDTIREAIGVHV